MNYTKNFQKFILFCILILLIFKSSNKKNVNKIDTREKNNNINITKSNDIQNVPKIRKIKDVLFINGYKDKKISHPFRYRILHQIEQLNSGFLESDVIDYVNFEFSIVTNYRIIIFFRCPLTQNVEKAIKFARSLNKKVLFDIDDLIFDIKYTNLIPYIKNLSKDQKIQYDDYVNSIGKTLKLCDQAITTTDALAIELKNYVSNIFINHNVASDEMWKLSEKALMKKVNKTNSNNIIIGYFSVSLYHNSDIEIIKKALIKILKEFKNAKLFLIGEFEINEFLAEFSSQIINKTYIDWKELIEIISNFDINIIPLEYNIFNEVKSENRWVEAALVKVPTIASNIGEFTKVINQNETGILCNNSNDWYISLKTLINNEEMRKYIGENAYNFYKKNYNSIYVGSQFANYINSIANKHIGFFIPCLLNSGGMYVILKHACILTDKGWDVDLILPNSNINLYEFQHYKFNIISLNNTLISSQYDVIVATLYTTIYTTLSYYKTKKHVYLVQNYETDFNSYGNYFRTIAEKTYSIPFNVEYITISKWCQNWLFERYKKKSKYAPNGIDVSEFKSPKRDLKNKNINRR